MRVAAVVDAAVVFSCVRVRVCVCVSLPLPLSTTLFSYVGYACVCVCVGGSFRAGCACGCVCWCVCMCVCKKLHKDCVGNCTALGLKGRWLAGSRCCLWDEADACFRCVCVGDGETFHAGSCGMCARSHVCVSICCYVCV